jgi:hypothetical protein
MCFGMTQTGQADTTKTMPAWLTGQAQTNIGNANGIASQPYVGQQVAGLTPDQLQSFGNIEGIAGSPNANNPYLAQIQKAYDTVGATPASRISAPSVLGAGVDPATASLGQYIDPSLQMELQPTLNNIERQREQAVSGAGGVGAQATGQGGDDAFGDSRAGVAEAQSNNYALLANSAATGQAYQNAFTNAANLRGIDLSNLLQTQTTNAGLQQQQLQNVLGSGNALQNLATSQTGQALTLDQALLASGQLQQQQNQAQANLPWLNNQGRQQFELAGLAGQNAATATATPAAGYSTTGSTFAPNNSGWALAGTLGGAILGSAAGPLGTPLGAALGGGITGSGANPYAVASSGGSTNGSIYPSASWLNNGFGL